MSRAQTCFETTYINKPLAPSKPTTKATAPTAATRGTFGQVNSTRDPRTLQLGIKVLF